MLANVRLRLFFLLPPESSSRLQRNKHEVPEVETDENHAGDSPKNNEGRSYSPCP